MDPTINQLSLFLKRPLDLKSSDHFSEARKEDVPANFIAP
jgi:hypothetical protein